MFIQITPHGVQKWGFLPHPIFTRNINVLGGSRFDEAWSQRVGRRTKWKDTLGQKGMCSAVQYMQCPHSSRHCQQSPSKNAASMSRLRAIPFWSWSPILGQIIFFCFEKYWKTVWKIKRFPMYWTSPNKVTKLHLPQDLIFPNLKGLICAQLWNCGTLIMLCLNGHWIWIGFESGQHASVNSDSIPGVNLENGAPNRTQLGEHGVKTHFTYGVVTCTWHHRAPLFDEFEWFKKKHKIRLRCGCEKLIISYKTNALEYAPNVDF